MNQFLNAFVESHKQILIANKSHVTPTKRQILDTIIMIVSMVLVALLVGYITKAMENLSYVLNIINITILGSFVLYTYSKEKQYAVKNNKEINVLHLIIPSVLHFSIILFGSMILLQLAFLRSYVSVFNLVIQIILFLFVVVTNEYLYTLIKQYKKDRDLYVINVISNITYNVLLFVLIIKLLELQNIMIGFTVTFLIMGLIYLFKVKTYSKMEVIYKKKLFFLVLLFFVSSLGLANASNREEGFSMVEFYTLLENRIEYEYEIEKSSDRSYIQANNDFIYEIVDWNHINIYDFEGTSISSIDLSQIDTSIEIVTSYFLGETFYFTTRNESPTYYFVDLYYIDNELQVIYDGTHYESSRIIPYDGKYYSSGMNYELELENGETVISQISVSGRSQVLYKDSSNILFIDETGVQHYANSISNQHNETYRNIRYSNDMILLEESTTGDTYICTIENVIYREYDQCITIDVPLIYYSSFTSTEEFYIVYGGSDSRHLNYFDKAGNLLYTLLYQQNRVENGMSYDYYEDEYLIADVNQSPQTFIHSTTPYIYDILMLLTLFGLVYLVMPTNPLYGGAAYDR